MSTLARIFENTTIAMVLSGELASESEFTNHQRSMGMFHVLCVLFKGWDTVRGKYEGKEEKSFIVPIGGESGNSAVPLINLAETFAQESVLVMEKRENGVIFGYIQPLAKGDTRTAIGILTEVPKEYAEKEKAFSNIGGTYYVFR